MFVHTLKVGKVTFSLRTLGYVDVWGNINGALAAKVVMNFGDSCAGKPSVDASMYVVHQEFYARRARHTILQPCVLTFIPADCILHESICMAYQGSCFSLSFSTTKPVKPVQPRASKSEAPCNPPIQSPPPRQPYAAHYPPPSPSIASTRCGRFP